MRDADANALCEEELPVRRALGRGEYANGEESRAREENSAEVARVREATGEGADKEEQEDIERADPGDLARGAAQERRVVRLEGAKGVGPAPADFVILGY